MKARARLLKRETFALYFAARDPRTPWYARVIAGAVVAYALSPIDLIPDFIPLIGYLDDIIIVPIGIALVLRMMPAIVLADSRARADHHAATPVSRWGAAFIITVWVAVAVWGFLFVRSLLGG